MFLFVFFIVIVHGSGGLSIGLAEAVSIYGYLSTTVSICTVPRHGQQRRTVKGSSVPLAINQGLVAGGPAPAVYPVCSLVHFTPPLFSPICVHTLGSSLDCFLHAFAFEADVYLKPNENGVAMGEAAAFVLTQTVAGPSAANKPRTELSSHTPIVQGCPTLFLERYQPPAHPTPTKHT